MLEKMEDMLEEMDILEEMATLATLEEMTV
jgi:hypothetical protein